MQQAEQLALAARALATARRVVVLTGAGVSAESGIPTFRAAGGLWEQFPADQFGTWRGLVGTALLDPKRLGRYLAAMLGPVASARPNGAHRAIAELERHVHATVVTQNVDELHQEAGSHGVRQIHGSLLEIVDRHGQRVRKLSRGDLLALTRAVERATERSWALSRLGLALWPLAGPSRHGWHRPNVVLFGQELRQPDWDDAVRGAEQCDLMLVVGTSGLVMPAASLPQLARSHAAPVILVDPAPQARADIHVRGRAGELMPELVRQAFGGRDEPHAPS